MVADWFDVSFAPCHCIRSFTDQITEWEEFQYVLRARVRVRLFCFGSLSLSGLSSLSGLEPLLPINQLYHNSLSTLLVWFGLVGCLFVCLFVWWICGFVDLCAVCSRIVLCGSFFSGGADDGIEEIVAGNLILKCLQTRTGIKFVVTAERLATTTTSNSSDLLDVALREIYKLYVDCVLKDPFYELEMPIRSELFVNAVDALMERLDHPSGKTTSSSSTTVGYNSSNHGSGVSGLRQR